MKGGQLPGQDQRGSLELGWVGWARRCLAGEGREGRSQRASGQAVKQQVLISNPPYGQICWRQATRIWDLFGVFSAEKLKILAFSMTGPGVQVTHGSLSCITLKSKPKVLSKALTHPNSLHS